MHEVLSILAMHLVAVTMALSLAHALEYPGKLRLGEAEYRTVQTIYYPGFTVGGLAEFGSLIVLPVLAFASLRGSAAFWPTIGALALLLVGHAVYWTLIHPTNKVWLRQTSLTGGSRLFFGLFAASGDDWKSMRDIWEWAHIARACLALFAFFSLTYALLR